MLCQNSFESNANMVICFVHFGMYNIQGFKGILFLAEKLKLKCGSRCTLLLGQIVCPPGSVLCTLADYYYLWGLRKESFYQQQPDYYLFSAGDGAIALCYDPCQERWGHWMKSGKKSFLFSISLPSRIVTSIRQKDDRWIHTKFYFAWQVHTILHTLTNGILNARICKVFVNSYVASK